MAAGYSTAAVSMGHLALKRAIRHAEANDLVSRNVATLADTPKGQQGRPSIETLAELMGRFPLPDPSLVVIPVQGGVPLLRYTRRLFASGDVYPSPKEAQP
jgi:hypothetical protein